MTEYDEYFAPFQHLRQGPHNAKNTPETQRKNERFKNAYYHILWAQGACSTRTHANIPVEELRAKWREASAYEQEQILWLTGWIKDRDRFLVHCRKCLETMLETLHIKPDSGNAHDLSRMAHFAEHAFLKMFFPELPPLDPKWLEENGYNPDGSPKPEATVTAAPTQQPLPQPVEPKPPDEAKQHAEPVIEVVTAAPPVEETPLQPRRDEKGRRIDKLGRPNGGNPKQYREKGKFVSLKEKAKAIAPDLVDSQPSPVELPLPNVAGIPNEATTA
jgi:hypothetical protein